MMIQPVSMSAPADVVDALRRLLTLIRLAPEELVRAGQPGPATTIDDAALDAVTRWLYAHWYTEDASQGGTPALPGRANLASALAVTVASSGGWESGWIALQSAPSGECIAGARNVTRHLLPGRYANLARPGIAPQPGDGLAVSTLIHWDDEQTGFWHMQSSAGEPAHPLMRVYWNVDWPRVGNVLERMTTALDSAAIRYALKCPFRPADYRRIDTIVVYVERAMWAAAEPAIAQVAHDVERALRTPTPPMTRRIGPGVAWAEDPGGAASFGESRCRALAPAVLALIRDLENWPEDTDLEQLMHALRNANIDPRHPWLAAPSLS